MTAPSRAGSEVCAVKAEVIAIFKAINFFKHRIATQSEAVEKAFPNIIPLCNDALHDALGRINDFGNQNCSETRFFNLIASI